MNIDRQAAAIEAAARDHATAEMNRKGNLWTRQRIRSAIESAVIRGFSLAKQDTVQATDELLEAARTPRPAPLLHIHENCKTCKCTDTP